MQVNNLDFEKVKEKLQGAAVSIATPMKKNYDLDVDGLRKNVRFLIKNGIVSGKAVLMAVAAAGECTSLSIEERKTAMKEVAEEVKEEEVKEEEKIVEEIIPSPEIEEEIIEESLWSKIKRALGLD